MKFTKTTLAASLALAATLGSVGQATAGIYAESALIIDNLVISFNPSIPGVDPVITSFDFTTQATAGLVNPTGGDASIAGCTGSLSPTPSTDCGGGTGAGDPVLYAGSAGNTIVGSGAAQVGIPTYTNLEDQALGTIAFSGPNGDGSTVNYAIGDAIIDSASLVGAVGGNVQTTDSRQITETEISSADQGLASSTLGSSTSYTYLVSIGGDGSMTISFQADPSLMVQVDDSTASDSTQLANHTAQWTLEGEGVDITWEPKILTAGGCTDNVSGTFAGTSCTEETTTENLNNEVTVAFAPFAENEASRAAGLGNYSFTLAGLTAGTYQLGLSTTTNVQVTRTQAVPEPATLSLLGMGLALCGIGARRRKARKA